MVGLLLCQDAFATKPHAPRASIQSVPAARRRRFGPFFVTQFLGAFNDNLFKNALVLLITFHAASMTSMRPEVLVNLAAASSSCPSSCSRPPPASSPTSTSVRASCAWSSCSKSRSWRSGPSGSSARTLRCCSASVPAGHALDFIRSGQVRDAAAAAARRGAGRRQRTGRDRHLHRRSCSAPSSGGVLMADTSRGVYLASGGAHRRSRWSGYLASRFIPHSPGPNRGCGSTGTRSARRGATFASPRATGRSSTLCSGSAGSGSSAP